MPGGGNNNPNGVGGWPPGQSGNPAGGRIRPFQLSMEARKLGRMCLRELVKIAKTGIERNRLTAIREILDRGFGKPLQMVDTTMMLRKLSELSPDEIVALEARLLTSVDESANAPVQSDMFPKPERLN